MSATSRDGTVTATVDSRGHLVDLKLRRSPSAEVILATVRAAIESAGGQVRELMGAVLPAESGAMRYMQDGDLGSLLRRTDRVMGDE